MRYFQTPKTKRITNLRRNFLLFSFGILFGTISIPTGIFLRTRDCLLWDCAPIRSFRALDLVLPARFFPDNIVYERPRILENHRNQNYQTSYQNIDWGHENCIACYAYYTFTRYTSNKRSAIEFALTKRFLFLVYPDIKSRLLKPKQSTYISPFADESFVACAAMGKSFGDHTHCKFIVRYQEFVLELTVVIAQGMTFKTFQEIVINLDEQIAAFFDEK